MFRGDMAMFWCQAPVGNGERSDGSSSLAMMIAICGDVVGEVDASLKLSKTALSVPQIHRDRALSAPPFLASPSGS